jgi:hypothetical protein
MFVLPGSKFHPLLHDPILPQFQKRGDNVEDAFDTHVRWHVGRDALCWMHVVYRPIGELVLTRGRAGTVHRQTMEQARRKIRVRQMLGRC